MYMYKVLYLFWKYRSMVKNRVKFYGRFSLFSHIFMHALYSLLVRLTFRCLKFHIVIALVFLTTLLLT